MGFSKQGHNVSQHPMPAAFISAKFRAQCQLLKPEGMICFRASSLIRFISNSRPVLEVGLYMRL